MANKGNYKIKNYKKYRGNVDNIVYRSSWECKCMTYFDTNPNVLWWTSEECIIPYRDPVTGKSRRYFPDFVICVKQIDGSKKTIMIEVKPQHQTQEPKVQKRKTKKYINEVYTYAVNQAKWKAAIEFCKDNKWEFQVITENELFGK